MYRMTGAPLALAYTRALTYDLPAAAFDSVFKNR